MLDKLQLWLKSKIGQPYAYYIVCAIYITITFIGLYIIGNIFHLGLNVVLIGILISILRTYTMGFHCYTNTHCFILSSLILTIFAIISKTIPLWVVFLLCLYSCADIYKKSPIEINSDFENKDNDWHFKRIVIIVTIYLLSSLITYYLHLYELCKCILLSLVIVDLLLFKNEKEYI